jgi:hypothetical protein
MVLLRAMGGAAMPVALLIGHLQRRAQRADRSVEGDSGPVAEDTPAEPLTVLPRRRLRELVIEGGDLSGVDLRRARLGGVTMAGAQLRGRDLRHAVLAKADLRQVDLSDAQLDEADLSGADLRGATLRGASLLEADLSGADLRGADLAGARHLSMALLRRSRHDRSTGWPSSFDPVAAGSSSVRT